MNRLAAIARAWKTPMGLSAVLHLLFGLALLVTPALGRRPAPTAKSNAWLPVGLEGFAASELAPAGPHPSPGPWVSNSRAGSIPPARALASPHRGGARARQESPLLFADGVAEVAEPDLLQGSGSAAADAPDWPAPLAGPPVVEPPPGLASAGNRRRAYANSVRAAVDRQRVYPPRALRLGHQGTARVGLQVNQQGLLAAPPRLLVSAGSPILDREALQTVRRAAPFPPFSSSLGLDVIDIEIPIDFTLPERRSVPR